MSELFHKLGVNWKLLFAQGVNFLIVFTVLRFTVYKPLISLLGARKEKIRKGIQDAEQARKIMLESETVKAEKIASAQKEGLQIIRAMEARSKEVGEQLIAEARKKEADILKSAEIRGREELEKEKNMFYKEAGEMVKMAIARTVEISPDRIDEKLIDQAVAGLSKKRITH
ncbi:MAG: hypothetical protein COU46_03420 [Candidatus Niyogibacteria bacterium CG10_big_fil_rev_8_21_14_0_10_42_19]|uniref:ATP synthase subunit b n=1 Tax=Candidatus Niyogibacteria bacterium CG10_big_fil_rev_8_21_14_0_10_42_19 TaxID=1974725 RepID=A0A2H0TEX8_9BACT|nr:MAG: hypothetical protein COU46_03420 [Candidatus Niyogibacteria bacterium CG10_big_fil_rev_8_21_14_0_10_42_19]